MIVLGIILAVIFGWLIPMHPLFVLGVILIIVGVILELAAGVGGYTVMGRRHWY